MALALKPELWTPDAQRDTCMDCMQPFSFFLWKHHCRFCGEVFCDPCSGKVFPLVAEGGRAESDARDERVCKDCYAELIANRATALEQHWAQEEERAAARGGGSEDWRTGEDARAQTVLGPDDGGSSSEEGGFVHVVIPPGTTYPTKMEDGTWVSSADSHHEWITAQQAKGAASESSDDFVESAAYPTKLEDGTWVSSVESHREWSKAQQQRAAASAAAAALPEPEPVLEPEPEPEPRPTKKTKSSPKQQQNQHPPRDPSMSDVAAWLDEIGLAGLAPRFESEGYEQLRFLQEAPEAEIGI